MQRLLMEMCGWLYLRENKSGDFSSATRGNCSYSSCLLRLTSQSRSQNTCIPMRYVSFAAGRPCVRWRYISTENLDPSTVDHTYRTRTVRAVLLLRVRYSYEYLQYHS